MQSRALIGVTLENPWLAMAGIFDPADPLVQEWKHEMAEYRQELESDPNRLWFA